MGFFSDKYIDEIGAVFDKQLKKRNVIRMYALMTPDERRKLRIRFLETFQEGFNNAKDFDFDHIGPRVIGISEIRTDVLVFGYALGALAGYLEYHPMQPIRDEGFVEEFSGSINSIKDLQEFHAYIIRKIAVWDKKIQDILDKILKNKLTKKDYRYADRFRQGPRVYRLYYELYQLFLSKI